MIEGSELLAPSTAVGTSSTFSVTKEGVVVYIAPDAGETLTEDDSFQLRRVIAEGPVRSIAVVDDGVPVILGANNSQIEILIKGTYLVKKTSVTTEAVGVYYHLGLEDD